MTTLIFPAFAGTGVIFFIYILIEFCRDQDRPETVHWSGYEPISDRNCETPVALGAIG